MGERERERETYAVMMVPMEALSILAGKYDIKYDLLKETPMYNVVNTTNRLINTERT